MANNLYEMVIKLGGCLDPSFLKSVEKMEKHLGVLGTKGGKTFLKVAGGATALVSASIAAGKALYGLGKEFDDAQDKIRIGTGATGEALDNLMNSAKTVYSQVPTSLEDTSGVISDYNTRLGLTGDNLEKISVQALQVSQALDEDVSSVVENSSRAFKNFGVAEDDMASSMDYAFKVSQSTGIGFNELLSTMQTGGAQLQALGFNFNESATLLGQFTKSGYDTSQMLMGLKTTAQQAIKDGFTNTSDALNAYVEQIKNAKSDTEALALANKKFGSRGGATFLKAIKDGTLDIKTLQVELENSGESIEGMAYDTYDLSEKMEMFKNRMKVALAPMANNVFDGINKIVEKMLPIIEQRLIPMIERFQPLIDTILNLLDPLAGILFDMLDSLMPALEPILGLVTALVPVLEFISTILASILNIAAKIVGFVAGGITDLIKGIGSILGFKIGGKEEASDVPQMAEGGIVTKPTLAMIGEGNEPEAVIPFSKMNEGNNITYAPNITISGDITNDRAKEIAKISFEEFKRLYQRMINENRRLSFATI